MDKHEFESVTGIKKGDFILIVRQVPDAPERVHSLSGIYDPVDSVQHRFIKEHEKEKDSEYVQSLHQRVLGKVFLLGMTPTMNKKDLKYGVHNFSSSGPYEIKYAECTHVRLLMKASELERVLLSVVSKT